MKFNKILLSLSLLSSFSFCSDVCENLYKSSDFKQAGDCYIKETKNHNNFINCYGAGNALLKQGKYKEAFIYLKKAEKLTTKEDELGNTFNRLSLVSGSLGDKKNELFYDNKVLDLAFKINNKSDIASAYANLGVYYFELGNKEEAFKFFNKSLEYEANNSITFNNLAIYYEEINDFNKAEEFYKKAIEVDLKNGDISILCNNKTNLGIFYYNQGNFIDANNILKDAKEICHKIGDIASEANSLIFLSWISFEEGKVISAKLYYEQAKSLAIESGSKNVLINLEDLKKYLNIDNN